MISKKDLSDAEMDTLTKSCSPTIGMTANGEVQTHEEATVYVKELDIFLTIKSSRTRQQYYRLESFAMKTGIPTNGSMVKKPHLIKDGIRIICNTENFVPIVVPGLSSSSSATDTYIITGKIQELQNENDCMNDSRDFQDAESVRSGSPPVTSQPVSFPPHPIPEGTLSCSFGVPSRREGPPSIRDTHGISGNVFANPHASSSAPYPQELNPWRTTIEEPLHMSTAEKSERPEQNRDLRCQSGPSAKASVIFSGGDYSKNYGADQQRLQISDLHFDKFPTPATFACWKIGSRPRFVLVHNFLRKLCNGSRKWSWLIQWMN